MKKLQKITKIFYNENMKKKLLLALLLTSGLLSSCFFDKNLFSDDLSFTFVPTEENSILYDGYYKPKRNNIRYTYNDINSQIGWDTSSSVGNQKLLIVPVQLRDAEEWNQTMLDALNLAFFGNSDSLAFHSVKDYFYQSSYGRLKISGEITPVLKSSYTTKFIDNLGESGPEKIVEEFKENDLSSFSSYDKDNDNYLDNVIFIYSNEFSNDPASAYWAWCTYHEDSNDELTINNYMWASFYFLVTQYKDGYNKYKYDTHTFIHEIGHLLGLDDYYDYNGTWDPAGLADMQSYNVGDHNVFSKFALGWLEPYVVTDSTTINLRTSSKYGDAILIKDDWNGSAFDEYLLIEYYTPTGLNQKDALHNYDGVTMYTESGLRIYHVDSRLVELSVNMSGNFRTKRYVDSLPEKENLYYYYVGASNTPNRAFLSSHADDYKLLHLLDKAGKNKITSSGPVSLTEDVLWDTNSTFIPSKKFFYNDKHFNDETLINYQISVISLKEETCTVKITKAN